MRLNLGSGLMRMEGFVNVDRRALPGVDVVHDLDQHPWPFEDHCADRIVALDVFEHLDDVVGAMDECWRIMVRGGQLTIRGPAPDSENLWVDVSHRRAFIEHSFDHFDWSTELGQRYRYGCGPWRIITSRREGDNWVFELFKLEALAISQAS